MFSVQWWSEALPRRHHSDQLQIDVLEDLQVRDPAEFLPTNSRRKGLIRVGPEPLVRFCVHVIQLSLAILSRCSERD